MKLLSGFLLILSVLFCFSSCEKGCDLYDGTYSFKTGGRITVISNVPDTTVVEYPVEMGQMHIVLTDDETMPLKVTMNMLGGTVVVFDAEESEKEIALLPKKRLVKVNIDELNKGDVELEMSGKGKLYKDVIVFDMYLKGDFTRFTREYTILDSDIECVATRNN